MSNALEKHEAECRIRYETFAEKFKEASERLTRVETAVYSLYPFVVILIVASNLIK